MHRTQSEFDDNLTFKVFIFQFINFYSSILYIAFFKGKFTGYPGHYKHILGRLRNEEVNIIFTKYAWLTGPLCGHVGVVLEKISQIQKYSILMLWSRSMLMLNFILHFILMLCHIQWGGVTTLRDIILLNIHCVSFTQQCATNDCSLLMFMSL